MIAILKVLDMICRLFFPPPCPCATASFPLQFFSFLFFSFLSFSVSDDLDGGGGGGIFLSEGGKKSLDLDVGRLTSWWTLSFSVVLIAGRGGVGGWKI